MWTFENKPYDPESFVGMLSDAIDNMYPDAKDRLGEMHLLYDFFADREKSSRGAIVRALWQNIQRRCREMKICAFCGSAEIYIDGERYCTQCDAAEVERLLREKEQCMREAV